MNEVVANKEVKRGELWYLSYDKDRLYPSAHQTRTGRPVVVVSGDAVNERTTMVHVLFLTSSSTKEKPYNPVIYSTGRKSIVIMGSISLVEKNDLYDRIGYVTEEELTSIDTALKRTLGLTDEPVDTAEELEKAQVDTEFWKRAYEKVLGQLVDLRIETDIAKMAAERKLAVKVTPRVEDVIPELKLAPEPEEVLVDINRCEYQDLRRLGFGILTTDAIIAARPFLKKEDLKNVEGVTRQGYQIVERRITVGDTVEFKKPKVELELVNINTVTATEMMEVLGMSRTQAYAINSYRNKNGEFKNIEELMNISRVSSNLFNRIRKRITV